MENSLPYGYVFESKESKESRTLCPTLGATLFVGGLDRNQNRIIVNLRLLPEISIHGNIRIS